MNHEAPELIRDRSFTLAVNQKDVIGDDSLEVCRFIDIFAHVVFIDEDGVCSDQGFQVEVFTEIGNGNGRPGALTAQIAHEGQECTFTVVANLR